jgi:hypothetical protein
MSILVNTLPLTLLWVSPGVGISFVVANLGHPSSEETAKQVLEGISHVSAIVATAICSILFPVGTAVWAGLSEGVDQLMVAIIEYALKDCDTVVAIDAKFFSSDLLFSYTFDPNDSLEFVAPASLSFRYQKKAGQILSGGEFIPGGGCDDSDYSVQLAIQRLRRAELFHGVQDPYFLDYGQVSSFGPLLPSYLLPAQVMYSNEGDGEITEGGEYRAPISSGYRKYDVITWTVYRDIGEGPQPYATDFAIVIFV